MFKASPFLVGDDCVSIMNGTDEGRVARSILCTGAILVRGAMLRAAGSTLSSLLIRCTGEEPLSDRPIPMHSLTVSEGLLGASIRCSS